MKGHFSHAVYHDMLKTFRETERDYAARNNPLTPSRTFGGVEIHQSGMFPFEASCAACDGTGEGSESTFCPKCKGAGRNRYGGVMRNGPQTILLTVPLPKAFAPSFPVGLVGPAKLSRGLV